MRVLPTRECLDSGLVSFRPFPLCFDFPFFDIRPEFILAIQSPVIRKVTVLQIFLMGNGFVSTDRLFRENRLVPRPVDRCQPNSIPIRVNLIVSEGEHGLRSDLLQAAEPRLAQTPDGLRSTEHCRHPLADLQTGAITGMAGGAPTIAEPLVFCATWGVTPRTRRAATNSGTS